jgi:hypothetical protein
LYMLVYRCRLTFLDIRCCIYLKKDSYAEFYVASLVSRPTSLQDRGRDSDDEDFRDRDYDVAALASNLSQAFKYGIYSNEDIDEVGIIFWNSILTAKI